MAVYRRGRIAVLNEGFVGNANNLDRVGGGVGRDPVVCGSGDGFLTFQAALFRGNRVRLIPPLTSFEDGSFVARLTDSNIALVRRVDTLFDLPSAFLFRRGEAIFLDLDLPVPRVFAEAELDINDRGRMSGTFFWMTGGTAPSATIRSPAGPRCSSHT